MNLNINLDLMFSLFTMAHHRGGLLISPILNPRANDSGKTIQYEVIDFLKNRNVPFHRIIGEYVILTHRQHVLVHDLSCSYLVVRDARTGIDQLKEISNTIATIIKGIHIMLNIPSVSGLTCSMNQSGMIASTNVSAQFNIDDIIAEYERYHSMIMAKSKLDIVFVFLGLWEPQAGDTNGHYYYQ